MKTTLTRIAPLDTMRRWLDSIEIRNRNLAHFLCQIIPDSCPFERDIKLLGHILFHLPPLCQLNPLYEQLVGLRWRSLCYLAGECE